MPMRVVLVALSVWALGATTVRPVRDAIGFCWNGEQMDRLCAFLEGNDPARGTAGPPLVAGVAPHDDFLYAGAVAWPLFRRIRAREVLLLGVTHGTVRKALGNPEGVLLLESHEAW